MAQSIVPEGRELNKYKQTHFDSEARTNQISNNCDEIVSGLWLGMKIVNFPFFIVANIT